MCRLAGCIGLDLPRQTQLHLLDRLLLLGQQDGGHNDGWGVTDGEVIYKSGDAYREAVPLWVREGALAPETSRILLGHVRKASTTTGRTILEAHPYQFIRGEHPDPATDMIAMHNGFFAGTDALGRSAGEPDTDSWRAFKKLYALLQHGQAEITVEIIEEWLGNFFTSSVFVCMILYHGKLHVIRGPKDREMYGIAAAGGFVLHSSYAVLESCANLITAHTGEAFEHPAPVDPFTMAVFDPVHSTLAVHQLNEKCLRPFSTHVAQPIVSTGGATYFSSGAGQKSDAANGAVAQQLYLPGTSTVGAYDEARRNAIWNDILVRVNPMRGELAIFWLAVCMRRLVHYETSGTVKVPTALNVTIPLDELIAFREELADIGKLTGNRNPKLVLNTSQRALMQAWNRRIGRFDGEWHLKLFGSTPFWLDERYVLSGAVDGWDEETNRIIGERLETFRGELDSLIEIASTPAGHTQPLPLHTQ